MNSAIFIGPLIGFHIFPVPASLYVNNIIGYLSNDVTRTSLSLRSYVFDGKLDDEG